MQRVIRIAATAVLLCTILSAGFFVYHHSTAHACGSYTVGGSNTTIVTYVSQTYVTIKLSLGYNSCSSSNFTQINVEGQGFGYVAILTNRSDGANSGWIRCPNSGFCSGASIYSPTLKAQACVNYNGNSACTDWF